MPSGRALKELSEKGGKTQRQREVQKEYEIMGWPICGQEKKHKFWDPEESESGI